MSTSLASGEIKETVAPCISAIQSYSLQGKPNPTEAELKTMLTTMFYCVSLSVGDVGTMYSFNMSESKPNTLMQTGLNSTNLNSADPEQIRNQMIDDSKILPGTSFMKNLLNDAEIAKIALAAPLNAAEVARLRTAGAYLALNKVNAETCLKTTNSSFMPLFFRQAMSLCPINHVLMPLTGVQMRNIQSLSCGLFAKGPQVPPTNGHQYTTHDEIAANISTIYTNSCNVIGSCPVITGTGFSDSLMIVY